MQLALIQFSKGGQANHLSGHLVAFAGHRGCEKAVQCFAFVVDVILRLHRFSRVVHREPSVPSALHKGSTLYEERDGLILRAQAPKRLAHWLRGAESRRRD